MGYLLFYFVYAFLVVALILNLLLYGVRPTKTLAWLVVIVLLPFVGMLLYIGLGLNRRRYKFFKLKKSKAVDSYLQRVDQFYQNIDQEVKGHSSEIRENLKLSKLIIKNSRFLPSDGNQVILLRDGPVTASSILQALKNARQFIHIQFYIFEEGQWAEELLTVFAEKIKAGVEVRLIYDGIGSRDLSKKFLQRLHQAGVQFFAFLPPRFGWIITSVNYRNHRKIIVVDGTIGFTGGINIADKYLIGDSVMGTWHDMHLRVEGPAVSGLNTVFAMDWYFVSGKEELLNSLYFPTPSTRGNASVQIVSSGPDSKFPSIRQQYFTTINQAQDYVYITNPYVLPGEAILEALQTAALSGVDVRLLIPEKSDNKIVKWSIRAFFRELLEAGVKIYLYRDGFQHGKTIVSDDNLASVGTANLDFRSFEQNFEINAVVYDTTIARELKKYFLEDCQKSIQLNPHTYHSRPHLDKFKEGIAKMFSPIL